MTVKTKLVWYPCRHSRRDGLYWSYRSMQETGTIMHEENDHKNLVRTCSKCAEVAKSGKKRKKGA